MTKFRLKAPIKPQLLHILEDYPGGQLLSEALQNAEDGGASEFALVLDQRTVRGISPELGGPAFVLIDNGSGFGDKAWESLQNLHQSEKRDSPSSIGAYGMGSRSYFHYSDVTLVVSCGEYVGLDPLEVVSSHERKGEQGWKVNIASPDGHVEQQIAREAQSLFTHELAELCRGFDVISCGAMFRLPLRRDEDVAREERTNTGVLGPAMPLERAESLMHGWAASAPRLLLFLTKVRRISIWRWRADAPGPDLIAAAQRQTGQAQVPFERIPHSLGEGQAASYVALRECIRNLSAEERAELSKMHADIVHIEDGAGHPGMSWLVVQRFDVETRELLAALEDGCNAVPVVGLALPLSVTDGSQIEGVPFCFLPVGSMRTGLPLHINGSFHPTPNRRDLWLPAAELDGGHEKKAKWNDVLMRHAVPRLWQDALVSLTDPAWKDARELDAIPSDLLLSLLPNLDAVHDKWLVVAQNLYKRLGDVAILPHAREPRWVKPKEALAFRTHTEDLATHTSRLIDLYKRCHPNIFDETLKLGAKFVVDLPAHVQQGSVNYSCLSETGIERVIFAVIKADHEVWRAPHVTEEAILANYSAKQLKALATHHGTQLDDGALEKREMAAQMISQSNLGRAANVLQPILMALLPYAAAHFSPTSHPDWRELLSGVKWVPTAANQLVDLASAFAPLPEIDEWGLSVVQRNRAVLECEAGGVRVAIEWGLKKHLTAADCLFEAQRVADENLMEMDDRIDWARRLIRYLSHLHAAGSVTFTRSEIIELNKIAFHPAHAPCAQVAISWADGADFPRGGLCLRAAESLFAERDAPIVWACAAYAPTGVIAPVFNYSAVSPLVLTGQIQRIASLDPTGSHIEALAEHLLKAVRELSSLLPRSTANRDPSVDALLAQLSEMIWVPAMSAESGSRLRLFQPNRVAAKMTRSLWPRFGRLPDSWGREPNVWQVLEQVGAGHRISVDMLARELASIAADHPVRKVSAVVAQRNETRLAELQAELKEAVEAEDYAKAAELKPQIKELKATIDAATEAAVGGLSEDSLELSINLASELAELGSNRVGLGVEVHVPTASGNLLPASQVFINDAPWHAQDTDTHELLNARISPSHGRVLGCSSVREQLARQCEDMGIEGEDFSQQEDLAQRIEGLLRKYDDEKDIFVEHYQNCDDAGADEVFFLLDQQSYGTDRLLTPESAALQGPSLILASSKPLTRDDLNRIKQLGSSKKRADFCKFGRFGLGLNAMYHLSDTIQIFARDLSLVILDPLDRIKIGNGGKAFTPHGLANRFPDMLAGFQNFPDGYPTIFRLPLRNAPSDFGQKWNAHNTYQLLERFAGTQVQELLLFAKSVGKVTCGVRDTVGHITVLSEVARELQASRFMSRLPNTLDDVKALERTPDEGLERVKIERRTGSGLAVEEMHWLIAHSLSVDATGIQLIVDAFTRKTKPTALLPHGAVALRLNAAPEYTGNVSAYLPIGMALGSPLVVHGCFALDDSRKQIPLPDGKDRIDGQNDRKWNLTLLNGPCMRSYVTIVVECCKLVDRKQMSVDAYFGILGLDSESAEAAASGAVRAALRAAVWSTLCASSIKFMPVVSPADKSAIAWKANAPDTVLRTQGLDELLQDELIHDGLMLVELDDRLRTYLDDVQHAGSAQPLTPRGLCVFLSAEQRRRSPELLRSLSSIKRAIDLLHFVLPAQLSAQEAPIAPPVCIDFLVGTPLLLLQDESIAEFGDGTVRFWNDAAPLLPHAPHLLLHENVSVALRTISRSVECVKTACASLGIRNLVSADLLEEHAVIHGQKLNENDKWLVAFWALLASEISQKINTRLLDKFSDWRVLRVAPLANEEGPQHVPLDSMGNTFRLDSIDTQWHSDVMEWLRAMRVRVPIFANYPMQLPAGDEHLANVLKHGLEHLTAKMREAVLKYFASRRQNSSHVLATIRRMPLFLKACPTSSEGTRVTASSDDRGEKDRFVSIDRPDVSYYTLFDVKEQKHKHAGNLAALGLIDCCFLSLPPTGEVRDFYYKCFGIENLSTLDFVTTILPSKLSDLLASEAMSAALIHEFCSWITEEDDTMSKRVIDALVDICFVPCRDGHRRKPKDLTDPTLAVAIQFEDVLGSVLPTREVAQRYLKALQKLGMRDHLKPDSLFACAQHLESSVRRSMPLTDTAPLADSHIWQSFHLVEALAKNIRHSLNRSDEKKRHIPARVNDAMRMQIFLADGPPSRELLLEHVALLANDKERPAQAMRIISCANSLLTSKGALPWACMPVLAQARVFAQYPRKIDKIGEISELDQLAEKHKELVESKFGIFSSPPDTAMIQHLEWLASAINQEPMGGRFYHYKQTRTIGLDDIPNVLHVSESNLFSEVMSILDALNRKLEAVRAYRVSVEAPQLQVNAQKLQAISRIPCIPLLPSDSLHTQSSDAERPSVWNQVVNMVEPAKLFWTLPEGTECQEQFSAATHYTLSYKRPLLTQLGVRQAPAIEDWAQATRETYERVLQEEDQIMLPSDVALIEAAVKGIHDCEMKSSMGNAPQANVQSDTTPLEIFLIDDAEGDQKRIHASSSMVWADEPKLKRRCGPSMRARGWHFVSAELTRGEAGRTLASRTNMHMLSDLVVETIASATVEVALDDVNDFDRRLGILLRSEEFAYACVLLSSHGEQEYPRVRQKLSNLIIKWATELHSVVKMKEDHAEIEESGRLIDTFIQDGVLWLRVGKLGGEGSDSFLRAIASSIMTIVTLGHLKGLVDLISKCWNGGPTEVQNCLEELNVREMTHSLNFEVGQLVPENMMRFCDQSLYSRFIFGEIVAIDSFESEWASNAQSGPRMTYAEYRGIVEDSGSGGQLARKYYLWEGGMAEDGRETLEVRPHVQVYKISRRRAQPPQLPHLQHDISDATQLQRSLAGVPTTATEAAATDDFSDLFDTLHQMLTMEKVAQRAYVRRLYLTWHPDKCEKPHAPRVFEYVRRFANLAQAGKEDELRAFVTSLTPDVEMQVLHQGYEERQEHSWFDEFREEDERRAVAVASHQSVDGRSGNVAGSTSNHAGRSIHVPVARDPGFAPSSSSQQVPRLRDAALGDVAWQMAQAELDAARLLHGHQMWAQSVFHSHQAAEQVIKAAMLRTCGVTGDEFRGTGGHALDSLLRMTGLVSPVQPDELALLSQAYLGARYPPFPPRGAPTVPLAMYGAVDAENALEVAKKLIEWGRCTAQVEASLTAQRAVPQRVCDDNVVLLL